MAAAVQVANWRRARERERERPRQTKNGPFRELKLFCASLNLPVTFYGEQQEHLAVTNIHSEEEGMDAS